MLACSFDVSASNTLGLLAAFGSALVFVSSNIFFKKIMPTNAGGVSTSHKLDKMNLLLYSSGMAFILMIPIWLYYDFPVFLSGSANVSPHKGKAPAHSVTFYFFMNGTVHYAQNIIAFVILSSTSPVTYSIASLIKRVAVICIAIVWFNQAVHPVQALGICMTFAGLYMYNNAKADVEKGEKKLRRIEATKDLMLPSTKEESQMLSGTDEQTTENYSEHDAYGALGMGSGTIYGRVKASSAHHHHRPPPYASLHIKTSDELPSRDSSKYPSPPPSHDSPTSETFPSPSQHGYREDNPFGHRTHGVPILA